MNFKRRLSLSVIMIFTLITILSQFSANAVINITNIKKDINTATSYVVKLEITVKNVNFNTSAAQSLLAVATKAVQKIKGYGKSYYKLYNNLTARVDIVKLKIQLKILTDKVKIEKAKLMKVDADRAALEKAKIILLIERAEILTNTDTLKLVGIDTYISNAENAINEAFDEILKFDVYEAEYKGLLARIYTANNKLAEVKEENNIEMEIGPAIDLGAELHAVVVAEAAVKALEAAPLVTDDDQAKALDLAKTAEAAVANVKEADKRAAFEARLKVVINKGLPLQPTANIISVSAVDGQIIVTLDKSPGHIILSDFKVFSTITTNMVFESAIYPSTITLQDNIVTINVPAVQPTSQDQKVVYSVSFQNKPLVSSPTYTVAKEQ